MNRRYIEGPADGFSHILLPQTVRQAINGDKPGAFHPSFFRSGQSHADLKQPFLKGLVEPNQLDSPGSVAEGNFQQRQSPSRPCLLNRSHGTA